MDTFDFDLDRVANALNMQGFDLVFLIDESGMVIAENSSSAFASEIIAKHLSSILQLSKSLCDQMEFGPLTSTTIEFQDRMLIIGQTGALALCGIPGKDTALEDAREQMDQAIQSIM